MLTSGFFHFFFCVLQDLIDLVACITYRLYYFSKYRQFFTHKLNIGIVVATLWTFNDMNITNSINKDHRKSDHIRQTWQLLILLMANIIFVTWRSFYCSTPKLKMINYFSLFFLYPHSTYGKDWHRPRIKKYLMKCLTILHRKRWKYILRILIWAFVPMNCGSWWTWHNLSYCTWPTWTHHLIELKECSVKRNRTDVTARVLDKLYSLNEQPV